MKCTYESIGFGTDNLDNLWDTGFYYRIINTK